jgi:hypothetical protein
MKKQNRFIEDFVQYIEDIGRFITILFGFQNFLSKF